MRCYNLLPTHPFRSCLCPYVLATNKRSFPHSTQLYATYKVALISFATSSCLCGCVRSVLHLAGTMIQVCQYQNTNLELVLPDSALWDVAWSEALDNWTRVVGVSHVCPSSQWRPCWDVVWNGCVTLPALVSISLMSP